MQWYCKYHGDLVLAFIIEADTKLQFSLVKKKMQLFPTSGSRITAPKDVHVLIFKTCEYATLHGKRKLADVIKLKVLRWENCPSLGSV